MKIPRKRTRTSGFDMNGCIACQQDLSVWSEDAIYVIIGDTQRIKMETKTWSSPWLSAPPTPMKDNALENFSLK
jgi:hypothetical protein